MDRTVLFAKGGSGLNRIYTQETDVMGCRRALTYGLAVLMPLAAITACKASDNEVAAPGTRETDTPRQQSSPPDVKAAPEKQAGIAGGDTPSSGLMSAGTQEGDGKVSAQDSAKTSLAATEGIGDIRIGQSAEELAKLMGEPSSKPDGAPPTEDRIEAVWKYADQGVTVTLSAPGKRAPLTVEAIVADESCPLRTRSGIGIGSDRAAVEAAYGDLISPDGVDGFVTVDFTDGFLDLTLKTEQEDGKARALVIGMTLSALVSFEDGESEY